ncbi:hypothetical protein BDF20DRAFT_864019, partial [Mycotypha africana]|uniref:uncharacterized protein n=1 Tax=Mycotypha africana TaxID=64632 RepID=UPI002300113E
GTGWLYYLLSMFLCAFMVTFKDKHLEIYCSFIVKGCLFRFYITFYDTYYDPCSKQ